MRQTTERSGPPFADWYAAEHARIGAAVSLAVGDPHLGDETCAEAFARALADWPTGRESAGWPHPQVGSTRWR